MKIKKYFEKKKKLEGESEEKEGNKEKKNEE